jgi:hypothetical protein
MRKTENGKLEETKSAEIKGVSVEMMRWWITHRSREKYRLWHPDHIDFIVKHKPEKGYVGYSYIATERFGKYQVSLDSTILEWTDNTATVLHKVILHPWPFPVFNLRVRMVMKNTPEGIFMDSTHTIGSDLPVLGCFWNFITRNFIYTDKLRAAYAQHVKEESENFPQFLSKLYAESLEKNCRQY